MEGPDGKPLVKRIASEEPENAAKSAMHIELAEKELLRDWGFLFAKMEYQDSVQATSTKAFKQLQKDHKALVKRVEWLEEELNTFKCYILSDVPGIDYKAYGYFKEAAKEAEEDVNRANL